MGCSTQYKDATPLYLEQIDVIKRLADKYPDDLAFVTTADGKNKTDCRPCLLKVCIALSMLLLLVVFSTCAGLRTG